MTKNYENQHQQERIEISTETPLPSDEIRRRRRKKKKHTMVKSSWNIRVYATTTTFRPVPPVKVKLILFFLLLKSQSAFSCRLSCIVYSFLVIYFLRFNCFLCVKEKYFNCTIVLNKNKIFVAYQLSFGQRKLEIGITDFFS